MSIRLPPAGAALLLGAATLLSTGCASPTVDTSLPVAPPTAFSLSGGEEMPARWWTAFDDEVLDDLVDEALRSNLDLETAWQRLREARAIAERTSSALSPGLDATLDAGLRRSEFQDNQDIRLGLTAGYEVDLWGRIGSRVDAERYRARASLADYRTVALSLSAEVARTWYELIEARSQVGLLEEQIETNEKVLRLLESRILGGQIRGVDLLRQRQLVEATRGQRFVAEARVEVLGHQLAVLLGRTPRDAVAATREGLPDPPALPATGLPTELVRRRPDVRTAFHELQAADSDLAAAVSEQYPRLTLSASLETGDGSLDALFTSWFGALFGGVVAPLLDGGERRAEVERSEAVLRQRVSEYGQTTLLAFREVEDALVQEAKQSERIRSLEEQVSLATRAFQRLEREYLNGVSNYLDVLTALTVEQGLRRELLTARRTLLEFRIALYRALGGGFETARDRDEGRGGAREGST